MIEIRRAVKEDLASIMNVMDTAKNSTDREWFVSDDAAYVEKHIDGDGFVIVAESGEAGIVGFVMIDFPGMDERNLGTYLGLKGKELLGVAHIDSAAVLPAWRGNHLQEKMTEAAEKILDQMPQYRCRMCTVHPNNVSSLRTMERRGYQVRTMDYKYGGLPRCILYKCENGITG